MAGVMRFGVMLIVGLGVVGTSTEVLAEPVPLEAEARVASGRRHLWRNLVWGGTNLVGGSALSLLSDRSEHPTRWAFGIQSAAWGAIDVGIAGVGLWILSGAPAGRTRAELIDKERLYHDALLFNMGLDVAYMAAGTAIVVASARGVNNADEWRGHGSAIIVQGAALLTFEVIAWLGTRRRLTELISVTPLTSTETVGLSVGFTL